MAKINLLQEVFPDAASIFSTESSSLENALIDGVIVLDTNTLLFPFNINKQSLQEIISAYKRLVNEDRLYIPAHVAREFAKNRASKLGEIYASIGKMSNSQKDLKRYPILSDISDYQELVELQKSVGETEKKIREKVKSVLETISKFERNDPVSMAYADTFDRKVVYQHEISDEDIEKDFKRRSDHKLPPGYKDGSKTANAEGDLIVWHTILELGDKFKKDLVFISSDGKPDWQNNVDKKPFQPRYELIDEYRRASAGRSFHVAPLSQLLETLDTSEETVQRVEWLEHFRPKTTPPSFASKSESLDEQLAEMKEWFLANYEPPENNLPFESREGGFLYIWGGPYDIEEVLSDEFGRNVSQHLIDICIEDIEGEYGPTEWSAVPQNENLWVSIHVDHSKCEDVGASGMFQVICVEDENGNDLSANINTGDFYSDLKEVLDHLSRVLKIEVDGELV